MSGDCASPFLAVNSSAVTTTTASSTWTMQKICRTPTTTTTMCRGKKRRRHRSDVCDSFAWAYTALQCTWAGDAAWYHETQVSRKSTHAFGHRGSTHRWWIAYTQIPLGSSHHVSTRHVRRVERVETSVSSRAGRQARHSQNAWAGHVERVVSWRDVTWRAKWNLGFSVDGKFWKVSEGAKDSAATPRRHLSQMHTMHNIRVLYGKKWLTKITRAVSGVGHFPLLNSPLDEIFYW